MTKELQPALRFCGFTDAWEQRKLGDVFEEYSEKNHGDLPPLTVLQGSGTIQRDESSRVLLYKKASLSNYKLVNKGDFILHLRSFEGGLEISKQRGIISPAYHTFHGEGANSKFYYLFFRSYNFINILLKPYIYGIRDGKNIDIDGMKEIMIPYPVIEEQRKIGEFFKTLDDLIAATERKKELLQKKKQAYLQLIFSQHLRFKGFTKPWEQRKLNDIAYKVTEKNNNFSIRETFTNSAELGIVSQLDFFDRNLSNAENIVNYYIVRAKDFVYNPRISAAAPVGPINCNNLEREGIISPLYTVFRTHCIDTNYLEWFFKSSDWHKFMRYYGDSGARSDRFSIKDSLFFEMPIPYPVIEEQRKIGEFFKTLDDLIAATDKKINLLKRRKKAYLQLMFI
ncbi:restriction endonuclease S subunit [Scardovia inopinata]|uniref:Type I restriction modification DNA specificity domain-containing protein n=1 Tax=Scardovia inopinata F0304 TaxID=641146 RepID=W5IIZ6_SCAIO|nr:restriction endonuclease subunit S [Scardovia inopinata]EFG26831.2 hypothetical protein HMPREF9020_00459 [Scardovia inopinata F0304]BAR06433.1 conserved hypothetical protein [Scardovia inopinata JCM 12537]SUV51951.1 restriction endonuclease S subunit [Scardovia inopinata]